MRKLVHILLVSQIGWLAACSSKSVELESRSINVDQTAEPAAFTGASSGLVNSVGPSYVTLTVSAVTEPQTSTRDRSAKSPVTSGSGFIVSKDGYVMTAAHVGVKQGNIVSARAANGRVYSGEVVALRPDSDMALIKLKAFTGHPVTPVANACIKPGTTVFSLGKPHAQGDTARFGVLRSMSFGHGVQYGKFGYADAMVIQMNTQKGESGGPLFDGSGRLAGMVVSTLADGNGQPLNMAHALPATTLATFLCSNTSCTPDWSRLASINASACPGS